MAIPRQTRSQLLSDFASGLKKGTVVAVHAARAGQWMEGSYWRALLLDVPFVAATDQLHSTDQIEAGWHVVKGQWYSLQHVIQITEDTS